MMDVVVMCVEERWIGMPMVEVASGDHHSQPRECDAIPTIPSLPDHLSDLPAAREMHDVKAVGALVFGCKL